MKKSEPIQELFEKSGSSPDCLVYLKEFRSMQKASFLIISADADAFTIHGELILSELNLLRRLGLSPVVYISSEIHDYLNIFYSTKISWKKSRSEKILQAARIELNSRLKANVEKSIREKRIPFVIDENPKSEFQRILSLQQILGSVKSIHILENQEFITEKTGKPLSNISLSRDMQSLMDSDDLSLAGKKLLKSSSEILNEAEKLKSISFITGENLIRELFTIKGSGTYIRRGTEIDILKDRETERKKLSELLEKAFRKKIKKKFLKTGFHSVIMEKNYRGAAIMKKNRYGFLLSKFAVDEIARGEGIGRDIWDIMKNHYSSVFWRSKKENTLNKWYVKEADGHCKLEKWNVYWINMDVKCIPGICRYLARLEEDFYER